jgi:hypothetical protein
MAEEMVLIPRVRYERLMSMDRETAAAAASPTEPPPQVEETKKNEKVSTSKEDNNSKSPSEWLTKENSNVAGDESSPSKTDKEAPSKGDKEEAAASSTTGNEQQSEQGINDSPIKKLKVEYILNEIPSKYRVKAERILAYIDLNGASIINWNKRGRLIYKEMLINGTNMAELLQAFVSNKGKNVVGFNLFEKGLVKINMPDKLLPKITGKGKKSKKALSDDDELHKKWLSY